MKIFTDFITLVLKKPIVLDGSEKNYRDARFFLKNCDIFTGFK